MRQSVASGQVSQASRRAQGRPGRRVAAGRTDTSDMSRMIVIAVACLGSTVTLASAAFADGPCHRCKGTAAGMESPCGASGCGPRYWGAVFEELPWKDPCDCQGRRIDCHGVPQGPEMLAPWQLPPCRGFTPPSHLGYGPTRGACDDPGTCHPCKQGSILGFRPGPLWWF